MVCRACFLLFTLSSFTATAAIRIDTATVYFQTDAYQLDQPSRQLLDLFVVGVDTKSDVEITVHGHADGRGSIAYNDVLSRNRAESVREHLLMLGIPDDYIRMDYHGELMPIAPNTSSQNLQSNRRVEITLRQYTFSDLTELEHTLAGNSHQSFQISPQQAVKIETAQGCKVIGPESAFIYSNGSPVMEPIVVEVIEALDLASFVAHNLGTKCGNFLLESGGMMHISASTISGSPVHLDPSKPLKVLLPTPRLKEGMQKFTSQDGQNWSSTGESALSRPRHKPLPKPIYQTLEWDLPVYAPDIKSKPRKPAPLGKLKEPVAPSKQQFGTTEGWVTKLFYPKRMDYFQQQYKAALKDYEERMTRYSEREAMLAVDSMRLQLALEAYDRRLLEWKEKIAAERQAFYASEPYQAAFQRAKEAERQLNIGYEQRLAQWRKQNDSLRNARMKSIESSNSGTAAELEFYTMNVSEMSWINVDRFYKEKSNNLLTVVAKDTDGTKEKVMILFRDINSVLPMGKDESGHYVQSQIPSDAGAELVALKVINGKPHIFRQSIKSDENIELKFEPCRFTDIKKMLATFSS